MLKQDDAMKAMAQGYLRLAKSRFDAEDRKRFLDYAAVYAELSNRSVPPETEQRETRRQSAMRFDRLQKFKRPVVFG